MLAASILVLGSCEKDTIEPEQETTPSNALLGFWHGGASYFGEDINMEFKETTMNFSDYANTQTIEFTVEYGDNKITINEVGTNDPSVVTYTMSGTSVTFTDEDNDSFTMGKGKGTSGGGGGGGGSDPHYEVHISDYTLTACSKTGNRNFNIETENKERPGTTDFWWQTVDEELDIPDDLPANPWSVSEEPNMSYDEIQSNGVFNIKLNYTSTGTDYSLGNENVKIKDYYSTRPPKITVTNTAGNYTWTLELDLDWDEE